MATDSPDGASASEIATADATDRVGESDGDPLSHRPAASVDIDGGPEPLTMIAGAEAVLDDERVIRSGRLAGKSLWQSIWLLATPVLVMQFASALVGTMDTLLAGNLPASETSAALDGVGFGAGFIWIAAIVMAGLGVGTQAIIARAMGAGRLSEAAHAGGNGVLASLAAGVLGGAFVWFTAPAIGAMVGLTPEANEYAALYIRIIALSMPALGVMTVGGMALHGAGETTSPSMIAVVMNVVNVLFSWALSGVQVSFGSLTIPNPLGLDPHNWGIFGIAAGTAISYLVGGVLTLWVLRRGVKDFRVGRVQVRPDRAMLGRILSNGVPNILEGAVMWLTTSIGVVAFIGEVAVRTGRAGASKEGLLGAHMIVVRWEAFSFLLGFAMGTAAGALAGQYLGAGSVQMARRATWACLWIGSAIMGALGVIFMTCGEPLARLMTRDPVALEEVPKLLFICGIVQIPFAVGMVVRQALKGCGDARWTLAITMVSMVFVRVPLAWFFGVALGLGLAGIWIGLCVELTVRGVLFMARFLYGRWERVAV